MKPKSEVRMQYLFTVGVLSIGGGIILERPWNPVPPAVKNFLKSSGYDSYVSLLAVDDTELKLLADQHGLLPGHLTVVKSYRALFLSTSWTKLTQQLPKPLAKELPPAVLHNQTFPSDEIVMLLIQRFQQRLAQWVKVEGTEPHRSTKPESFKMKMIERKCERKIGVDCPFCGSLVMLFFKMTGSASFNVIISNYTKHYLAHHQEHGENEKKKQKSLLEIFPSSLKRKSEDINEPSTSKAPALDLTGADETEVEYLDDPETDEEMSTEFGIINPSAGRDHTKRNRSKSRLLNLSTCFDVSQSSIMDHFLKSETKFDQAEKAPSAILVCNERRGEGNYGASKNYYLNCLLEICRRQEQGKKLVYTEEIKRFAMCCFITGGRSNYVNYLRQLNLPSPSTLFNYFSNVMQNIREGTLRSDELDAYRSKQMLSKFIWSSEDATAVKGQVDYDPKEQRVIGRVNPDDPKTGLPIVDSSFIRTAQDIKLQAETDHVATDVNVVLCTSLSANAAPFCLLAYGVGKSMKAATYVARNLYITEELKKRGMINLGFSGDGAAANSSGMKQMSKLGQQPDDSVPIEYREYFYSIMRNPPYCLQDHTHAGGKLKNRLLTIGKVMRIGNFFASVGHLIILIQKTPVTEHGLSMGEIKTVDRMNFKIVEKLVKPEVTQALSKHVEQSEGTVLFLKLINYVTQSFMEPNLTVLGRVRRIWYAIFFLRYWRAWLTSKGLSLADFYVTHNAEFCVELNGHELLQIIRYCADNNCPEVFLPTFFNSQWNEGFFRQMRSMGSTFSTVVNFTVKEFLQRVKRAEFLIESEVELDHKMNKQQKQRDVNIPLTMPSSKEIGEVIEIARKEAEKDLASVGVMCKAPPICHIAPSKVAINSEPPSMESDNPTNEEDPSDDCFCINMKELFPNINYDAQIVDCTTEYEKASTKSAFVQVTKLDGSIVYVKVATLVKIFRNQPARMSSDRLQRFIRSYPGHHTDVEFAEISTPGIYSVVNIGDWCLFNVKNEFRVAQVLGFQYKTPKGRYKPFRLETAPVEGHLDDQTLVVHGSFYTINSGHQLEHCYFKFPLYVKRYAGHINSPQKVGAMLLLDDKSILFVNELAVTQ